MQISLLAFLTVAEKKNFSRAAKTLAMTQPAVSQQIQSLEEQYGAKLFERDNKRVELTRAGEILYQYAAQIVNMHQESRQAINDLLGLVTGKLKIGASLTVGEYVLPKLLAIYTSQFPDVNVSVTIANTEEIAEYVLTNEMDVGLVEGPVDHPKLVATSFLEDELVLIVPPHHPFADRSTVGLLDLKEEVFIVREEGSGTRFVLEELLKNLEIHPKEIQFGSTQAIKGAVEAGLGISCISKWTLEKELRLGTLKVLRIQDHPLNRQFSLVVKKGQFQSRSLLELANLALLMQFSSPLEE